MKWNRRLAIFAIIAFGVSAVVVVGIKINGRNRPARPSYRIEASEGTAEDPLARSRYEWTMIRNPNSLQIPRNFRTRENAFVNRLSEQMDERYVPLVKEWTSRGPVNIGGRTKALAIDVLDENVILAGGVSSGMWKSVDGGKTWEKTTAPDQLHSVSCIVQNTAPGHENIWYYGTGEWSIGNGGSAAWPGYSYNPYFGDGIFKSTDGGDHWAQLPSTVSGTAGQQDPFDFIWGLATFGEDGVFAATSSGLFKSTDGGGAWDHVLDFGDKYPNTEIAMAPDGTFYATIGGQGPDNGVYRSGDGIQWDLISPPDWPDTTIRTVIGIVPSNERAVYFFTCKNNDETQLRKYVQGTGWTDLTSTLPNGGVLMTYGGAMLVIKIKPDDENTLFIGAMGMYRSMDGGLTFERIGAISSTFHVDQHSLAFFPSDPKKMIVGNDGGLFKTGDNTAPTELDPTGEYRLVWEPLNNGYLTTQFYTVGIDHGTPGSETISGGMQDNGCMFTTSPDPQISWKNLIWGDGGFSAITNGGQYHYTSVGATFHIYKHTFENGEHQITEVTPASVPMGLWLTLFILDPHDQKVMYLPSQDHLWRNSDLSQIPYVFPLQKTDLNWTRLENVDGYNITALGMSEAEPRRLYYGSYRGDLFRIDNPQEGQPVPVKLPTDTLPPYSHPVMPYIHCLAVDPKDADKVIMVIPSYEIISIYSSEDGGMSWTPVGGNLEEQPNGRGDGPSVRWVSILYVQDQPVYFAGTSTGLFSTTKLDSMNTVWVQEGAETIGNVVVDMIDVRQSDGFVVVGTHGNGVYSASVTEIPSGVRAATGPPMGWELSPVYPNPFNPEATVRFTLPASCTVHVDVFNLLGERVAVLADGRWPAGEHRVRWNAGDRPAGTYVIRLSSGGWSQTRKVILLK